MKSKSKSIMLHFLDRLKERHGIKMSEKTYVELNKTLLENEPIYKIKCISVHRLLIVNKEKNTRKEIRILFKEDFQLAVTCIPKGISWLEFMHLSSYPHLD